MNELENLPKPKIRLVGEDGNAYSIMGIAQKGMRKEGWTQAQINAYLEEATSGDYDNLLATTMKYCNVS
jgi:hypothetical protein